MNTSIIGLERKLTKNAANGMLIELPFRPFKHVT